MFACLSQQNALISATHNCEFAGGSILAGFVTTSRMQLIATQNGGALAVAQTVEAAIQVRLHADLRQLSFVPKSDIHATLHRCVTLQ